MARAGLGSGWECAFANDFSPMKVAAYRTNWDDAVRLADINDLTVDDLPGAASLAWASFPCQDLSLAGNARGIGTEAVQTRSGAFWAFWRLMQALAAQRRAPTIIVLENVYGALTANDGRDFAVIARCLSLGGYRFGALMIDAERFVPQSRPRLFVVAIRDDCHLPAGLLAPGPRQPTHPVAMSKAIARLAEPDADKWLWFAPPPPPPRRLCLADIVESNPTGVEWHNAATTRTMLAMMAPASLSRLAAMRATPDGCIGTIYKRTRFDEHGNRVQRAELRNDQISGCLRTPGGGSSRQTLLIAKGESVRTRLLSPREAARLMGLPDSYRLPTRYNDAYHLAGDGVVVPVVDYLRRTLLEPILYANTTPMLLAAA